MGISTVGFADPESPQPAPAALPALRPSPWNVAVMVGPVLVWAALIWHRRWMSDDGLIVLRTVRQIAAGNGPVFNVGERVETNTSALWGWLLVLPDLVPGVSLNWASVVLGLVLSVGGLAFALDGARRLWHADGRIVPAGALVVCALPPFWDFGTSGLETGLVFGWLGATWWMLVRLAERHRDGVRVVRVWPTGVVIGLGPLIRPDLALVTLGFGVLLAVLARGRGVRRLLGAVAVSVALPVGYQIFRAAYYGILVPAPALAKEAAGARWDQGGNYLVDLIGPYQLWLPVALLVAALAVAVRARPATAGPHRRGLATGLLVGAPMAVAVAQVGYVTRVGGDFMHGRLLLPALFCFLMPLTVLPLGRLTAVPLVGLLGWSAVCAVALRTDYSLSTGGITDERLHYVVLAEMRHPVTSEEFRLTSTMPEGIRLLEAEPAPAVAISDGPRWWLLPATAPGDTVVHLNLGIAGETAPLETRVVDPIGLSDPLAGHSEQLPDGRIGHSKNLPPAWYAADAVTPGGTDPLDAAAVESARLFLACPQMAELLASYRAPLTLERAVANVLGAPGRTALRFARDPLATTGCRVIG